MGPWRFSYCQLALSILLLGVAGGCGSDGDYSPGDSPPVTEKLALAESTYWGGSVCGDGATHGRAMALDAAGCVYLAGETQSPSFPVKNPVQGVAGGGSAGFVTKFTADGQAVVYSTLVGSSGSHEWCTGIAVDAAGNAVVVGLAGAADFPLRDPIYDTFTDEWECGFLLGIAPSGGSLNFSTLIPQGVPTAVALGPDGAIYLATSSNHVLKVSADGRRLLYDFQLDEASRGTWIEAISVDGLGRVWLTGYADSGFTPLLNPLQPAVSLHGDEALVARVNAAGTALDFSTLLGGTDEDFGQRIALGGDGLVYVLGSTNSRDFPVRNAANGRGHGDYDGFLVKIDPEASRLLYATYVGGDGEDHLAGLAVTATGEVWIAGLTTSSDLPVTGSYQDHLAGVKDALLAKLSADGAHWLAMSYFGGSQTANHSEVGADWCTDLALGGDGKVYLTGETYSSDFPLKSALDPVYSLPKAFLAEFREL